MIRLTAVPKRVLSAMGGAIVLVLTLIAFAPSVAGASVPSSGLGCVQNGAELTISAPGSTINVLRNGKWIKQVKGLNLADNHVDFTDTGYTQGDTYQVVIWLAGTRTVIDCDTGSTPPPPPPPPAVKACEANLGVLTVNGPGTDFNVLRNGKWINHVKGADLADDQPDFTDSGNTPGDTYEVVFWIGGQRIVVSCTDTTPPTAETPAIDLTKFINGFDANNAPGPQFDSGTEGRFGYRVINTGDVALTQIMVSDDTLGTITCSKTELAPGERVFCTATKTLTGPATVFMEANTKGTSPAGTVVTDSDPVNFTIGDPTPTESPAISLVKKVNGADANGAPGPVFFLGAELTFTYDVHNTGNVALEDVAVVDDTLGTIQCPANALAVGESFTCSVSKTVNERAKVTMRAQVAGTSPMGTGVSDNDPVHFEVRGRDCYLNFVLVKDGESANDGHRSYVCDNGGLRVMKSPVALDVDGSGSVERVDADIDFDFAGNGEFTTVDEWFAPTEGILINTTIPGPVTGEHLFGDQNGTHADGFAKLAMRDRNGDGQVAGEELDGLAIWTDTNTNGTLDQGELSSLSSHGVVGLSTIHTNFVSEAFLGDGTTMVTEDVWFAPAPTAGTSTVQFVLAGLGLAALAVFVMRARGRRDDLDTELRRLTDGVRVNRH